MKSVEVDIFGRRFRLRSNDPEETLLIASGIDKQLNELKDMYEQLDFTKLLLLLALQQEEKVLNLGRKNQELSADLDRVNQMIGKLIGE